MQSCLNQIQLRQQLRHIFTHTFNFHLKFSSSFSRWRRMGERSGSGNSRFRSRRRSECWWVGARWLEIRVLCEELNRIDLFTHSIFNKGRKMCCIYLHVIILWRTSGCAESSWNVCIETKFRKLYNFSIMLVAVL